MSARLTGLSEDAAGDDPLAAAAAWWADAQAGDETEPSAMQVATAGPDGNPTVRTVLCRGIDERGFRFFTNVESRKGRQLAERPGCSICLVWPAARRQVLATGTAQHLDEAEVAAYWSSRPRGSQVSAWASRQSQPVADRAALLTAAAAVEHRFEGEAVLPVPPWWGGYVVVPDSVELWCGRPDRLHDRLRWTRDAGGTWVRERLQP